MISMTDVAADLAQVLIGALAIAVGYAIGAINPAAMIARARGIDLRSVGSGNPGATNVGRAMGPRWAVLVGALDILKGFVPALAFTLLVGQTAGEIAGAAAVLGHVTSPYLRGRGGKGVATTLGALLGALPLMAIPVLIGFAVGLVIWRRVGLGAILGAGVLGVSGVVGLVLGLLDGQDAAFCVFLSAVVLVRHWRNMSGAWKQLPG